MSEQFNSPASASQSSPGWYPDPAGSHLQRWWDGNGWTDNTYDPFSAASAPGVYATVGPDVKVYTPWVWIIAALPLIGLIAQFSIDYRQYLLDSIQVQSPGSFSGLPASFGIQLALGAIGWGVYLLSVLLAFFDWRVLKSRGVEKPFHWAWTFLSGLVYLIGRPVVLKRRGRSAFAPLWVYIALFLLTVITAIVKVSAVMPEVIEQISTIR